MIVATFCTIIGECTTTFGIFDSKKKLKTEFKKYKKRLFDYLDSVGDDEEDVITDCHYKRNMECGKIFTLDGYKYMIIKPNKKHTEYEIHYDERNGKKKSNIYYDFLLIRLTRSTKEYIDFTYIINNSFVCISECSEWIEYSKFKKLYPNIKLGKLSW